MALLDLPTELFQHIIHDLVTTVGVSKAAKYRLTCKIFAYEIYEDIIVRQDVRSVIYSPLKDQERLRFTGYGRELLYRRLPTSSFMASKIIKQLVDELLHHKNSTCAVAREQYTKDLCNAYSGASEDLDFYLSSSSPAESCHRYCVPAALPAAAAAIGNMELYQKLDEKTLSSRCFEGYYHPTKFPEPVHAAIANGHTEFVAEFISHQWGELISPLYMAARNCQTEIGKLILHHMVLNPKAAANEAFTNIILECCLRYGDCGLLVPILDYRKAKYPNYAVFEKTYGLPINNRDVGYLFKAGSRSALIAVFHNRSLGQAMNHLGPHLPLDLALQNNRYDLARTILVSGTDIEARECFGEGLTALQLAAQSSFLPHIQFLLENGADPYAVLNDLEIGKECNPEALQLCEMAAGYAKGAKPSRDEWRLLWQTERHGLLAKNWDRYEDIKMEEI